jgi:hypothetical protein
MQNVIINSLWTLILGTPCLIVVGHLLSFCCGEE